MGHRVPIASTRSPRSLRYSRDQRSLTDMAKPPLTFGPERVRQVLNPEAWECRWLRQGCGLQEGSGDGECG